MGYIYILASKRNGTLYAGVTAYLVKRVSDHKEKRCPGFTQQYGVDKLVYYEKHTAMASAIKRETQLKKWNRAWKISLIEKTNPDWKDLFEELI